MSFGFGVGDIIAVATLAWKLFILLRSTKDASASYHKLIQELESTAQSLYHVGKQLETAGLPSSPANCVNHGLSRCHSNLRSLDVIVRKYAKSMQTPQGRDYWWGVKAELKKISWEMCEKERVDEIRRNIRSGMAEIMLILDACGLNAMRRVEIQIQQTFALLKRDKAAVPQGVETWYHDQKVIYLDNALGRSITIPFELCAQWEIFNETLKLAFHDSPGNSWIEAMLFKITTQDNEQVLPENWECSVKPRTTLLMSMVVQKHPKPGENLPISNSPPVCNEPQLNFLVAGKPACQKVSGQIQCPKSLISYPVSDVNDPVQAFEDNSVDNHEKLKVQLTTWLSAREEEIRSFKRLHLVTMTRDSYLHSMGCAR